MIAELQRQLQAIRAELERVVFPPLAAEFRRILPSHDAVPSAGALRIHCVEMSGAQPGPTCPPGEPWSSATVAADPANDGRRRAASSVFTQATALLVFTIALPAGRGPRP